MAAASESFSELGLPGLVMAGAPGPAFAAASAAPPAGPGRGDPGDWSLALGWASLERDEPLAVHHRLPAYLITALVTATAVLRLAATDDVDLDAPANRYLRTVRLADNEVAVRELLTHTGGVDSPDSPFGNASTELVSLTGPVVGCSGERGTFRHSIGGEAVLGQLIADATGEWYQDAVARLVLRPLGMTESSFPASWPERDAVTGYQLDSADRFEPVAPQVCVVTAAGGLWSTAADLARFGAGWSSLLPAELAAEALRPQAPRGEGSAAMGLGWATHPDKDLAGIAGGGPGAGTSLLVALSTGRVSVTMANRFVPMEPVNARVLGLIA
jgi:CubicO group peptidase (beta-lactamase class C family)